jgi:hypothetical protein
MRKLIDEHGAELGRIIAGAWARWLAISRLAEIQQFRKAARFWGTKLRSTPLLTWLD